ncbi:unnamed protein product [Anisakis simplex]|uniref:Transmembrane protein 144 (inferred by orthology to a human protein) n=1 Tax=Anisakis simplex TaxID=6269 RepID=A0A0M3JXT7_ANISI|nr:unnamed protein product [Anisakis simplex]
MSTEELISTTVPAIVEKSVITGLTACAVASVCFGSMFVPVKKFDAGDGLYVQWLMSIAILIISFGTWLWEGLPPFYPLAMIGGNVTAIPIIRRLGMAMGMLIWNTTNCLAGWAGGNFGLFGMKARPASNPLLNYIGLVFVIVGGVLFSQVKGNAPAEQPPKEVTLESLTKEEKDQLSSDDPPSAKVVNDEKQAEQEKHSDSKDRLNTRSSTCVFDVKKGLCSGLALALGAGFLYGTTFAPVIYIQDNVEGADGRGLPKNNPIINNTITLPALCAGTIWIVAQTSFFIANENLSQTVSFPIITMVPGCVASVWSILLFKEIRGARNLRLLGIAIIITLCGALMVGLSKDLVF